MTQLLNHAQSVLTSVAALGRDFKVAPDFTRIDAFRDYLPLSDTNLDSLDDGISKREALVRFLLLSAIADQGPDIEGVRDLVIRATNEYYAKNIRIFHRPEAFFDHFDECIRIMDDIHETIKLERRDAWAQKNQANAGRYMLYLDNASQTLGYAIARWGPPLSLARALHEHSPQDASPLVDHLRKFPSTELMSSELKSDRLYGVGKAIGDKAAHLFGKWVVYSYPLLYSENDAAWDHWSFEVPFDSNAGRVLYRTGLLLEWATRKQYEDAEVLQAQKGKKDTTYLRVTNLRGIGSETAQAEPEILRANRDLCVSHLKTHKRNPAKVEVQRIPSVVSLLDRSYSPGQIDDGLIKVGTTWCFNTGEPICASCPLNATCAGYLSDRTLIDEVRT